MARLYWRRFIGIFISGLLLCTICAAVAWAVRGGAGAGGPGAGIANLIGDGRLASLFQQIITACSSPHAGMSLEDNFDGTVHTVSFQAMPMNGSLKFTTDGHIDLNLTENDTPSRTFQLTADKQGNLKLALTCKNDESISLTQEAGGKTSVQGTLGGTKIDTAADSYVALYDANRDVMDAKVLPVLKQAGVTMAASIGKNIAKGKDTLKNSPLMANGLLQKLRPQLSKIAALRLDGNTLALDRSAWEDKKELPTTKPSSQTPTTMPSPAGAEPSGT